MPLSEPPKPPGTTGVAVEAPPGRAVQRPEHAPLLRGAEPDRLVLEAAVAAAEAHPGAAVGTQDERERQRVVAL